MSIIVGLHHHTRYEYDRRVGLGPHVVRLRPAPHCRTPIVSYSIKVSPEPHFINWMQDPFSNYMGRLVFPETTRSLVVDVDLVADLTAYNPFDFFVEDSAERFPFEYSDELRHQLIPFLKKDPAGPKFAALLDSVKVQAKGDARPHINDFLVSVNQVVWKAVNYTVRMEPGVQAPEETLDLGWGSCRDSGWLLVQLFRHLGLAARFVSGYLVQLTPDMKSLDGPSGPESDFTDLHAWCEVYIPGAGWLGLDPTSGLFAAEGHIPLCCTPDPQDAAPITGLVDECECEFHYRNEVTRLREDPRVTKPFSDRDWLDIDALGHAIDEKLERDDVRLTMGGEPTFVSIDDMESAQWDTEADGPEKRERAFDLSMRLKQRFAKGGLTHFGQGKWYPGEPLPRWQYALYWRQDGVPLWKGQDDVLRHDASIADARALMSAFCSIIGLDAAAIHPAHEDPFHSLWQHGQLPVDEPDASGHEDLGKRTLARVLEQGLDHPVGYVIPLGFNHISQRWESCLWRFRHHGLYLLPGNSAMGYRLPLGGLSSHEKLDVYSVIDHDPFEPLPQELRPIREVAHQPLSSMAIHTAVCAEVREGYLYVFMPPVDTLEAYVGLLEALAEASERIQRPLRIEGYPPPSDPRLKKLVVAPDPGVIEVNVQPGSSWDELKAITEGLYADAREARLGTEKFMLDGRHTGTGGGNHVTLGGASPADSPLLRRPQLLRSLLTFWQHHPSLSYLFSGLFIGPTSQAPRVDEARTEKLYELDIAFSQLPAGEAPSPWIVDRVLRHLLTDLTGNTHRSEFCIDKLYSPDSATGRLGILEFRGFEMPPHARMSLVQQLLLRACVACFWDKPYARPLVDWGHALHDRFMLPHFLWEDFKQVTAYLRDHGFAFQDHWFDAFREFRCPKIGSYEVAGMTIDVHHALEPWHVLGEESSSFGTARFVDSSLERLQVRLRRAPEDRYVLTCNGRAVPLAKTEEEGCYVAGIRYRAWQPWSALHPTIGVHSPIILDLYDTWSGRSLGGCTYHVVHPGGRAYETYPVNPLEAEARRVGRFEPFGHEHGPRTPQPIIPGGGRFYRHDDRGVPAVPPQVKPNPKYPFTLDMRFDS